MRRRSLEPMKLTYNYHKVALMLKLSVNYSNALQSLIRNGEVNVDAIEVVDKLSPGTILAARQALPGIGFHFHPGRVGLLPGSQNRLKRYLALCPQSPHISLHLAPLPFPLTYLAFRYHVYLPESNAENRIKVFIKQVTHLKTRVSLPIILENMPVLHPTRYRFESDPRTITRILHETDCNMLLDLAHARIAAQATAMTVEDYLLALPLDKVKQVHLSGSRTRDGVLYDAHLPLLEEDYALVKWILPRIIPDWVTLEYFREDRNMLITQLLRLKSVIKI
ncbi:MAG: DUF692 family protein [Anaerolineaceae bacterium]|nr:DUF692 family protein [Anaerolineaceae bacterium]